MKYSSDPIINSFRRNIISSFLLFDEDPKSVKIKVDILKNDMPKYKDFFTRDQLNILRYVYKDYNDYVLDGFYDCIGLSEASIETMIAKYPNLTSEYVESLTYQPLPATLIKKYLKSLQKSILSKELCIPTRKLK